MEFRLDEGQVALQETVRRSCASRFALERIADRERQPTDRVLWKELGARSATYAAAAVVDDPSIGDPGRAVAALEHDVR
jgi:hypothetical protein